MNSYKNIFCEFIIDCQLIEELLKKSILLCAERIKNSLKNSVPSAETSGFKISYNISSKELEHLSMRELLNRFERFGPDSKLNKNLKHLSEIRNEIVHKEFILFLKDKEKSEWNLRELSLVRCRNFSKECLDDLFNFLERL